MSTDKIIESICSGTEISFSESFEYCKECSELLRDVETASLGRGILINILDNWKNIHPATHEMWTDVVEAEGFYPYLVNDSNLKQTAGEIRRGMSKSRNLDYFLHDEQLQVKNLLDSDNNVILSAPTSFGKSLLIEELVAEGKYKNIVVIQPTLALLDETRNKLNNYSDKYSIIVRTSQEPVTEKGNLFLLTAERVMEYRELPTIDLLIIDEFYKLSAKRDDERSDVLNNAFHLLLTRDNVKFYLLGPSIDGISKGFAEKYNAVFYKTDYSLVEQYVEDRSSDHFGIRGKKKDNKEQALFNLLLELKDEQTLIYCSSPARARSLAKSFLLFLVGYVDEVVDDPSIIEWIEQNISKRWGLIDLLRRKIAFHDGALQKHITASIIAYFNDKDIHFLFCTSTIIEGVNTSAKNIIIFDKHKGKQDNSHLLDFFDYSNIKGRAGRLMEHYTGKVFNFNEPFIKEEELIVDIPFFQQAPIKDEVLLHLEDNEVKDKETEQYKKLHDLPQREKDLFKQNGVLVYGQKKILEHFRSVINEDDENFLWSGLPRYNQLKDLFELAWNNLLKDGETHSPMTFSNLTRVTFYYARNESINWLVEDTLNNLNEGKDWLKKNGSRIAEEYDSLDMISKREYRSTEEMRKYSYLKRLNNLTDDDLYDEAIRTSFNILRHWFQYKVPKWLRTLNSLQEFVCNEKNIKPGNYSFYADKIESDFVRDNLSILLEYGIPKSAVTKLSKHIDSNISESAVVDQIKHSKIIEEAGLLQYEKERINKSL